MDEVGTTIKKTSDQVVFVCCSLCLFVSFFLSFFVVF